MNNTDDAMITRHTAEHRFKVCHVIGNFVNGGVESVLLRYLPFFDKNKFEIHIVAHGVEVASCLQSFVDLGCITHIITPKRVSLIRNIAELYNLFSSEKYDVVHSHLTEWACAPLFAAARAGVPIRINHSHMVEYPAGIRKIYYKARFMLGKKYSTHYFACGESAARYLFGNEAYENGVVNIVPNAFNVSDYRFNKDARLKVRNDLCIDDETYVIGHVGRFERQKNHELLLDLFSEFHSNNPNSVLLLVGDGSLRCEMQNKIEELDLVNSVNLLGVRDDLPELYSSFDLFVFPSLYEGLGIVLLEAQMAGLPVVASSEVPIEADVGGNLTTLSVKEAPAQWAKVCQDKIMDKRVEIPLNRIAQYDIDKAGPWFVALYECILSDPTAYSKKDK